MEQAGIPAEGRQSLYSQGGPFIGSLTTDSGSSGTINGTPPLAHGLCPRDTLPEEPFLRFALAEFDGDVGSWIVDDECIGRVDVALMDFHVSIGYRQPRELGGVNSQVGTSASTRANGVAIAGRRDW